MYRIEKHIEKLLNEKCLKLGLKKPRIKFNGNNDISCELYFGRLTINIDVFVLITYAKIKNDKELFKLVPLNSVSKRLKFIIYHELGHYLQFRKYFKWSIRQHETYRKDSSLSAYEYRQQKIEKYADKIALYLVNR
jgi:hypothetical protein